MFDVSGHQISVTIFSGFHSDRIEDYILRVRQVFLQLLRDKEHTTHPNPIRHGLDILFLKGEFLPPQHFFVFSHDFIAEERNNASHKSLFQNRSGHGIPAKKSGNQYYLSLHIVSYVISHSLRLRSPH